MFEGDPYSGGDERLVINVKVSALFREIAAGSDIRHAIDSLARQEMAASKQVLALCLRFWGKSPPKDGVGSIWKE